MLQIMMMLCIQSAPLSYKQMEWFWNQYKIYKASPVPVPAPAWLDRVQKSTVQEPLWKVTVTLIKKVTVTLIKNNYGCHEEILF